MRRLLEAVGGLTDAVRSSFEMHTVRWQALGRSTLRTGLECYLS